MKNSRITGVIVIGLLAISSASIFIKKCAAPPLVIASYRLVLASVFYWGLAGFRKINVPGKFSRSQLKIATISGVFLTIHFVTWISSLKYTSVASSVALVQSAPIFVVLGGILFLREKPTLQVILGVLITIAGGVIISLHDFSFDKSAFWGNLLAVAGAFGAAGYMLAGRKLRESVDLVSYVTLVYSVTAVFLVVITLLNRDSLVGYSPQIYGLLFAIAMVPQVIGHTSFNWALKYLSATTVSIIILGEPVGASILAIFFLSENLSLMTIVGGLIIIAGVVVVILAEARKKNPGISIENE